LDSLGQNEAVSSRQEYLIVVPEADRQAVAGACDELLKLLSPDLRRATVDAFSDYRDLDGPVAGAFDELRRRADTPKNAMAVPLDLSDPAQRDVLDQVAAWTIHAEVSGPDGELATFHDCGAVMTAHLTAEQADILANQLQRYDGVQLITLEAWRRQKGCWPGRPTGRLLSSSPVALTAVHARARAAWSRRVAGPKSKHSSSASGVSAAVVDLTNDASGTMLG
jgi:hypothetical protein